MQSTVEEHFSKKTWFYIGLIGIATSVALICVDELVFTHQQRERAKLQK